MRKKHLWKAVASSLLAFSLVVSACPVSGSPFVETVEAAELETAQTWNFDDGTTQSWSESGWSSTGFVGSTSNVDNRLKFTTNYTDISVEWYQGDIQLWDSNGIDCRGVSSAQMELYCKEGDELPTQIQVFLVNDTNAEYKSVCTMDLGDSTGTETISGETYKKYQLTGTFADNAEDAAAYKQTINSVIIQVVRSGNTFNGDVYFDNIIFQKESSGEGGVGTTGVVYEDAGPVVVSTTEGGDYPYEEFTVSEASNVTLPKDTVIEYTMEIAEGKTFTELYWETKIGWECPEDYTWIKYFSSSDFTANKRIERIILDKEYKLNDSTAGKWKVQVQTKKRTTDDVGVITCSALKITLPSQSGGEPSEDDPETDDAPVSPTELLQPSTESVTIDATSNWPTFEFTVPNGGDIQLGTTIEYDVVVANNGFAKLYLETDVNWVESDVRTLKGSDFTQNADGCYTKHVTMTYVGEKQDSFGGVQVKIGTGDGRTDYLGTISIKNLTYTRATAPASVDESAFVTSSLYSGSTEIAGWGYAKLTQSVPKMAENGYFRVEYDASEKTNVRLVLCQWNTDKNWVHVRPSKTGTVDVGTFFAEYSYDACKYAFGSANLSVVNEICVTVYANTGITLKSAIWKGPKVESNPGGNYDSGSSDTSSDDKKETDKKDEDNKNEDNKDDNTSSAPVITQSQGQNHAVEGHEFVVTKGGEDGKAEVAFMDAPTNAKKVVIPKTVVIDGVTCKVTSIAAEAFKGNTKLTNVTIGSNITKIGDEAFAKCTSLTKVTVPASVTEIGEKAFYGCKKVQTVTIGKKVTTIEASAFEKCTSLKKVVISDSVKKIESKAFNGCKNLKKITITSTKLKTIGSNALKGLDKNAVIDVPDNMLKAYKKLFTAKTGFKKTMKLI